MLKSEEQMQDESCINLLFVRGRLFPGAPLFPKENIERALDFQPRDTDILISAFPRCGTNWLKYIVHTIISRGQKPLKSFYHLSYKAVPFLDVTGIAPLENLPDPRPMQYHLPYDMIPKNLNAKYIYIFRNPKDTVVSLYHYIIHLWKNVTFDELFDDFMKGMVPYGDYFEHVLSWYEHRNDTNVLFLSYEQLQADTKGQLLKIANFIGENYEEELSMDNELLEKVLQLTSFQNMKESLTMKHPNNRHECGVESNSIDSAPSAPTEDLKYYFRNGIVGDWKNYLSPEQNRRMDTRIQEKFGGTEINGILNTKSI